MLKVRSTGNLNFLASSRSKKKEKEKEEKLSEKI